MEEIWKKIEGLRFYEISNMGRVRSVDRVIMRSDNKPMTLKGQVLKTYITWCGYEEVGTRELGRAKYLSIHREVAKAFIPNPQNKPDVNHKDGNTLNNRVDNLEWVTKQENMQHAMKTGLWHPENRRGEKHPLAKLTWEQVKEIKRLLAKGEMSQHEIALMMGTTDERISCIKHGKSWN